MNLAQAYKGLLRRRKKAHVYKHPPPSKLFTGIGFRFKHKIFLTINRPPPYL